MGTVELLVPCQKKMMPVVRMTAMGVASQFSLTLDAMDDVKMAVEEACRSMMLQKRVFESLRLRFAKEADGLHVSVIGCGERTKNGAEGCDCTMEVMRCILESMADVVRFETDGDGLCAIHLVRSIGWNTGV